MTLPEVMPLNLRMEQFSMAFIRAIIADAGCKVFISETDTDSVDGMIMADLARRPRVEFQAKSTSADIVRDGVVSYPLRIEDYKNLIPEGLSVPRILIVVLLPSEQDEWTDQTEDRLCLRRCAYWISLEGKPDTDNSSSITLDIPAENIFNSEQLRGMMYKLNKGKRL